MTNRVAMLLIMLVASVFLVVAAACGTSSEDDSSDTDTTSETSGDDTSMDDMDDMDDMPTHSVSGVPIDPNARFGGVLLIATTSEGPTFSNWEEAAGERADVRSPRRQYACLQAGLG